MDILNIVRSNLNSVICTKHEYAVTMDCVAANVFDSGYASMDGIYDDIVELLGEERGRELYNVAIGAA